MKPIGITLILVTLSAPVCFGEWLKVATSNDGDTFHIDYVRIRERGEYVYFWQLADADSPKLDTGFEWMSAKSYKQGDCDQFRYKELNLSVYSQPMGRGTLIRSIHEPDKNWTYPPPNSVAEFTLKTVCDHVKSK